MPNNQSHANIRGSCGWIRSRKISHLEVQEQCPNVGHVDLHLLATPNVGHVYFLHLLDTVRLWCNVPLANI